jgi:hypothetical protein
MSTQHHNNIHTIYTSSQFHASLHQISTYLRANLNTLPLVLRSLDIDHQLIYMHTYTIHVFQSPPEDNSSPGQNSITLDDWKNKHPTV